MIITNIFEIGFRIPDDMDVLKEFEESNDLFEWSRSESTGYITYKYISVKCCKRGGEDD